MVSASAACSSPKSYDLAAEPDGTYTFRVTATDAAGNASSPATHDYALDRTPPAGSSRILFDSNRDGASQIYVMNPDGSAVTRVTTNGDSDTNPVWSPNGARIAYVNRATILGAGTARAGDGGGPGSLPGAARGGGRLGPLAASRPAAGDADADAGAAVPAVAPQWFGCRGIGDPPAGTGVAEHRRGSCVGSG